MSNMSYCRFQNTLHDLKDCASAVEEILDRGDDPLGGDELEAATHLVESMAKALIFVAESAGIDGGENVLESFTDQRTLDGVRWMLSGGQSGAS